MHNFSRQYCTLPPHPTHKLDTSSVHISLCLIPLPVFREFQTYLAGGCDLAGFDLNLNFACMPGDVWVSHCCALCCTCECDVSLSLTLLNLKCYLCKQQWFVRWAQVGSFFVLFCFQTPTGHQWRLECSSVRHVQVCIAVCPRKAGLSLSGWTTGTGTRLRYAVHSIHPWESCFSIIVTFINWCRWCVMYIIIVTHIS